MAPSSWPRALVAAVLLPGALLGAPPSSRSPSIAGRPAMSAISEDDACDSSPEGGSSSYLLQRTAQAAQQRRSPRRSPQQQQMTPEASWQQELVAALDTSAHDRYLVFRCRPGDGCHGFGDRVAGLLGAAFLALSTDRALRIDWPELSEVYEPNLIDWVYNPEELRLSQADREQLDNISIGEVDIFPALLSPDVAVLRTVDFDIPMDAWRGWQSPMANATQEHRVLIYSGNYGGTEAWYDGLASAHGWPVPENGWRDVYVIIFEALFRLKPTFAEAPVSMLQVQTGLSQASGGTPSGTSLQAMLDALATPGTFSLGVHMRAGDKAILAEGKDLSEATCAEVDPPARAAQRLQCLEHLVAAQQEQEPAERRILAVFSDSHCLRNHTVNQFRGLTTFTDIWTQELEGSTNIDDRFEHTDDTMWLETMRDWTLMNRMDMLAVSTIYWRGLKVSGFPASTVWTARNKHALYELNRCMQADDWRTYIMVS